VLVDLGVARGARDYSCGCWSFAANVRPARPGEAQPSSMATTPTMGDLGH
jgi:hypothetical protein